VLPDRDPADVVREVPLVAGARGSDTDGHVPGADEPAAARRTAARTPSATTPRHAPDVDASASVVRDALAALEALGPEGTIDIDRRPVKLTNLDKVLFPPRGGEPITKRDLVRYYVTVAPTLLPHLAGRPLNLTRYPNGVDRPSFWQRELPQGSPAWLTTWREPDPDRRAAHTYVIADSVATMAWLANAAAVEIHPWTSRIDEPWRPIYALIDIDPGPDTRFPDIVLLATLYRAALEHLGVRGYPKMTGKRGIQVFVPIEPRYTYDDTRAWVETLSRAVGAAAPDLVSWEWSVDRRGGRARLDYTQNVPTKTLVAPYSVRAAAGAPVSAPITWDELDDPDVRPDSWTLHTLPPRLAERGDLFAAALTDLQLLPAF
jgi:bifunctional non-homologous end joining protein LigD